MKKSVFLVMTALLATAASPALTQDRAADEGEQKPKKEKKICRSERVTGSLTRVNRICLTRAEWDEVAARTKKGLDEMASSAAGGQAVQNNAGAGGN